MFYKGTVVKDTGRQFRSNFQRVNISGLGSCNSSTREYSVWWPRPGRLITHSQIYILKKSLARLNLPMLLMQGMMTTFKPEPENASHDNVDDFNEDTCDVHSTENNVEVQKLFEDDRN